jgi:RapZ C-terminal domain
MDPQELLEHIRQDLDLPEDKILQAGPCVILMLGDDRAITIYDGEFPQIFMDELDETDTRILKNCGKMIEDDGLLEAIRWIVNEVSTNLECPGFEQLDGDNNDSDSEDNIQALLPKFDVNSERKLTITSWGVNQKGAGGHAPSNSQLNVNASVLCSSKKGLNLKQMDGRDKRIQQRICRASAFYFLLRTTIERIEKDDLSRISVNCSRGRHRSVAFAEILRDYYYPNTKVIHPNLRG